MSVNVRAAQLSVDAKNRSRWVPKSNTICPNCLGVYSFNRFQIVNIAFTGTGAVFKKLHQRICKVPAAKVGREYRFCADTTNKTPDSIHLFECIAFRGYLLQESTDSVYGIKIQKAAKGQCRFANRIKA